MFKYQISLKSKLFYVGGRTDMAKPIVAFRNFARAPKFVLEEVPLSNSALELPTLILRSILYLREQWRFLCPVIQNVVFTRLNARFFSRLYHLFKFCNKCIRIAWFEPSVWVVSLTTHVHLVPWLRMEEAVLPLPCTPLWSANGQPVFVLPLLPFLSVINVPSRSFETSEQMNYSTQG
jgi:hypothetical protein